LNFLNKARFKDLGFPASAAGLQWVVDLVASCRLLFTAQPEALAFVLAGAFGWAVND
jgi:hypothetical protein